MLGVTPKQLIVWLIIVVVVALIIALVIVLRLASTIVDNNHRLTREVNEANRAKQKAEEELRRRSNPTTGAAEEPMKPTIKKLQQEAYTLQERPEMTNAELMAWIDKQMDEQLLFTKQDLDLKSLSQALNLTQRCIVQVLKTQATFVPATLNEYLTNKRLAYACKLLVEEPNWTVDAIAHEAGFSARKTFQTQFKDRFGLTPTDYKTKRLQAERQGLQATQT